MEKYYSTVTLIANDVYTKLGPGFSESIYQSAMIIGLNHYSIPHEREVCIPIKYNGFTVGYMRADLIIGDPNKERIVIELKAVVNEPRQSEINQTLIYMNNMEIKNGMVINFPQTPITKKKEIKKQVDIITLSV